MGVEKFEDLIAWQKSRELAMAIYLATRSDRFAKDFGLSSQIQCAAVSVMSNIAEGFERKNPSEFHHFLVVAKASCAEVRSQLYLALDIGYLSQLEFSELLSQTQEVSRIVGGLRASVDRQPKPK
ncbi:MAG: four helix bundle protein [Chloroflexota bacterium]